MEQKCANLNVKISNFEMIFYTDDFSSLPWKLLKLYEERSLHEQSEKRPREQKGSVLHRNIS